MYRKRNGSLSFSFSRFVTSAVPNFASSWEPGTIDVSPYRQDKLYVYQTSKPWPTCLDLDENSFYVAGTCDRERQSERIFVSLLRNGVLNDGSTETGYARWRRKSNAELTTPIDGAAISSDDHRVKVQIDTTRIGPKFIHQLAFISQTSQKNLISVLFFWEEEVYRLRKLEAEEKELDLLISASDSDHNPDAAVGTAQKETLDQLKFARERIRMKKRQRPSQRDPRIESDTDATVAQAFAVPQAIPRERPTTQPPAYHGHAMSV